MQAEWCICGHGFESHDMGMKPACAVLIHDRTKFLADRCECEEFKVDTLRYLEDLSYDKR